MLKRVFLLITLSTVLVGAAQEKVRIAVLPFSFNADVSEPEKERIRGDLVTDIIRGFLSEKEEEKRREVDTDGIAKGITNKLQVEIAEMDRFQIVERGQLETILQEQALGQSGVVDQGQQAETGKVSGVDLVIAGSVDLYSISRKKKDDKKYYKCRMSMGVKFLDPESGVIKKARNIEKSGKGSSSSDARYSAIGSAISIIKSVIRNLYPLEARIMRVMDKEVMINLGSSMGMRSGQYFKAFRMGERVKDEFTGEDLGAEVHEVGIIKTTKVNEKYSRAKIIDSEREFKKGDKLSETSAKTRVGITAGFPFSQGESKINSEPQTIRYRHYDSDYTWSSSSEPDDSLDLDSLGYYDDRNPVSDFMGFYLALEFYQIRYSNMSVGLVLSFMSSEKVQNILFDLRVGYEFPFADDKLFIPLGAGIGLGRFSYEIKYVEELQSHITDYKVGVQDSKAKSTVHAGTFGFVGYSGLRVQPFERLSVTLTAGYRFHFSSSDNWEGTEKVMKWDDEEGGWKEEEENFDIDQRYLPHNDVSLNGLDLRAGVTFVF
ncbi:MAG: CsgG/HfaB family protein [Chitinivibrionales bacterium]